MSENRTEDYFDTSDEGHMKKGGASNGALPFLVQGRKKTACRQPGLTCYIFGKRLLYRWSYGKQNTRIKEKKKGSAPKPSARLWEPVSSIYN